MILRCRGAGPAFFALGAAMSLPCTLAARAQQPVDTASLPDAPSATLISSQALPPGTLLQLSEVSVPGNPFAAFSSSLEQQQTQDARHGDSPQTGTKIRPQQTRVFGILPNFTSISGGTRPKPAGWKINLNNANKQNFDYTALGFLTVTSAIAYAQDSHPSLSTVNGGNAPYWAYLWRGFVDKTDGVYQGSFFFPSLLHQDVRYYAMGEGPKWKRTLHAVDSIVIARSYSGRPVFNVAGLAGKVGTQAVSTTYYPAGSEGFGVLAEKFAYACLRQAGFVVLREFSPDIAVHLHRRRN